MCTNVYFSVPWHYNYEVGRGPEFVTECKETTGSGEDAEEETYFCAAAVPGGVNTEAIPKDTNRDRNLAVELSAEHYTAMKMKKSFANITIRERMTSKFSAVLEIII